MLKFYGFGPLPQMKNLTLNVISLLALAAPAFAQGDTNVLNCFTHEEMGPSYEFSIFKTVGAVSYYGEYTNTLARKTLKYSIGGDITITAKALKIEVGPGPEAGGREIWYTNGYLTGSEYKTHGGGSLKNWWTSELNIQKAATRLQMTCVKPAPGQEKKPRTRQ